MKNKQGFDLALLAIAPVGSILLLPLACSRAPQAPLAVETAIAPPQAAVEPVLPEDAPLEAYRRRLLALAFDTASAMPLQPHVKDRSLAQEQVVECCLRLRQPRLAEQYLQDIADWRRGACYAELAGYWAREGHADAARRCIDKAMPFLETDEDWHRDTIRVKLAQAHVALGNADTAAALEHDLVDSEVGKVAAARARLSGKEEFAAQFQALQALIPSASGNLDIARNAVFSCAELHDAVYEDLERRQKVELLMRDAMSLLPFFLQQDLYFTLADQALDRQDTERALELLGEAQRLLEELNWPLEYRIQRAAKLAGLRFRAGDEARARADADALLPLYEENKREIINMFRAAALRPLVEAYHVMGDREATLRTVHTVLDAGVENPNSRPRALDLSATCLLLAERAIEPDDALWARLEEIHQMLGDPW